MSHEVVETMFAYSGEVPWHGIGKSVPGDLTPQQMLESANLDWKVELLPLSYEGGVVPDKNALVRREKDGSCYYLDVVGTDWNPVQNEDAFNFFHDFVMKGDMHMHVAGALKNGSIVFALAKIDRSIVLPGNDEINNYFLFTNFHKYGFSTDIRVTSIRVVCNNTLVSALREKTDMGVRIRHNVTFNPEEVKKTIRFTYNEIDSFEEKARYLASKTYTKEEAEEFFSKVFPSVKREKSNYARKALEEVLQNQPGSELNEGTYWQLFNTVTYMTDHMLGRTSDTRLESSWYGRNARLKNFALETALEMAS